MHASARTVALEAAFTLGILGAFYETDAAIVERDRSIRVGLNIR